MASTPDDPRETIRSLEQLHSAADQKHSSARSSPRAPIAEPGPPPALPPLEPAPGRAPDITSAAASPSRPTSRRVLPGSESAPKYRCLACGYSLLPESEYRCAECGRQYDAGTLELYFDGAAGEQVNRLSWFVQVLLVVKLWMLTNMAMAGFYDVGSFQGFLFVASGVLIFSMCYMAGRDRLDSIGGYYATAGMAASFVSMLGIFQGVCVRIPEPILYGLDAVAGCLLLLAMLTRPDGAVLWRSQATRGLALTAAIAIPPLVAVAYGVQTMLFPASPLTPPPAILKHFNSTTLAASISIAVWIWVRQWIVGFRKNVLSPPEEA